MAAEKKTHINLNGDEIDTIGFGRDIDHVEYIDIDAPVVTVKRICSSTAPARTRAPCVQLTSPICPKTVACFCAVTFRSPTPAFPLQSTRPQPSALYGSSAIRHLWCSFG